MGSGIDIVLNTTSPWDLEEGSIYWKASERLVRIICFDQWPAFLISIVFYYLLLRFGSSIEGIHAAKAFSHSRFISRACAPRMHSNRSHSFFFLH